MSESLMGGYPGNPTWSQRALDDLQHRVDEREGGASIIGSWRRRGS